MKTNPWDKEFYIVKRDHITLYLFHIKSRATKKDIPNLGSFLDKASAELYLRKHWESMLEKEIENILLVND